WILARSKKVWTAARMLLLSREKGERTPETIVLRARLERDAGEPPGPLAAELDRKEETQFAAVQLLFEEAWERDHLRDAAMMDLGALRENGQATIDDVYAVEAAMLAGLPDAAARAEALRAKLSSEPHLLAFL